MAGLRDCCYLAAARHNNIATEKGSSIVKKRLERVIRVHVCLTQSKSVI